MNSKQRRKQKRIRQSPIAETPVKRQEIPLQSERLERKGNTTSTTRKALQILARVLEALAIVGTIATIAQFFYPPSVQTPSAAPSDSVVSLPFEIKNESALPLLEVEYECIALSIRTRNGIHVSNAHASADFLAPPRLLWGREAMTARCDRAFQMRGLAIEQAECQLVLRYWAPPWPFKRHAEYNFVFIPDASGLTGKWVPK